MINDAYLMINQCGIPQYALGSLTSLASNPRLSIVLCKSLLSFLTAMTMTMYNTPRWKYNNSIHNIRKQAYLMVLHFKKETIIGCVIGYTSYRIIIVSTYNK